MREFYRINEARESWIFLCLGSGQNNSIEEWAVGVGNISHLIRSTDQSQSDLYPREALLDELRDIFKTARSAEPVIVTPDNQTVSNLRQNLITSEEMGTQSLRGIKHIDLEAILVEYFDERLSLTPGAKHQRTDFTDLSPDKLSATEPNRSGIESLWEILRNIAPITPARALIGEPL